jgi:hypothetical protein
MVLHSDATARAIQYLKFLRMLVLVSLNPDAFPDGKIPDRCFDAMARKVSETAALLFCLEPGDVRTTPCLVDLAAGTSDIAITMARMYPDVPIYSIEANAASVRIGRAIASDLEVQVDIRCEDVNAASIPGGIWLAKHPCGTTTDDIIDAWVKRPDASKLILMTCCHGRAQNSPRYDISPDRWRQVCRRSDWTNSEDPRKRQEGQKTMDELDALRIRYIQARVPGAKTELRHAEEICCRFLYRGRSVEIYKGNILVASRT